MREIDFQIAITYNELLSIGGTTGLGEPSRQQTMNYRDFFCNPFAEEIRFLNTPLSSNDLIINNLWISVILAVSRRVKNTDTVQDSMRSSRHL